MHPLPKNSKEDDTDSLFDFLDADKQRDVDESVGQVSDAAQTEGSTEESPAVDQPQQREFSENPFPVIRKPVSVNKTGALKAPEPNQPVQPPPPITDAVRASRKPPVEPLQAKDTVDFDDLDKIFDGEEEDWPDSDQWVDKKNRPDSEQWLEDESASGSEQWIDDAHRPIAEQYPTSAGGWGRRSAYAVAFLFILSGLFATIYSVPQVRQWSQDTLAKVSGLISSDSTESENSVAGFTNSSNVGLSGSENTETSLAGGSIDDSTPAGGDAGSQKSLNTLFREELAKIELLVEQGDLDGVESALQTMDPLVFGYGSTEFTDIQNQLALSREQPITTDDSNRIANDQSEQAEGGAAEALAAQEQVEAERAEAARQAEQLAEQEQTALAREQEERRLELEREAAAAAEEDQRRADRLAQEKARAEQFRIALEERARTEERLEEQRLEEQRLQALREEEERLAELRAEVQRLEEQRLEEQRLAEQRLEEQRLEEQRLAEQRLEEQRLEEQRRAEQLAEEQRLAEQLAQEQRRAEQLAERLAEEQRLAELREEELRLEEERLARQAAEDLARSQEQIAARQREAARQQRLADARANEAQQQPGDVEIIADNAERPADDLQVASVDSTDQQTTADSVRPIAEAELQQVYRQFAELETAIESRDINAVVRLTENSGSRIQQVMQIFENNVSIEAQLRNVSTLDSAGEIRGTLQITRLQRVDGSVTGPPGNFDSVPILSVREGGGWSQIRW